MFVLVGKEADDVIVIGRVESVLAELRLYWPSCSISAVSVDSDRFCHINTVLLILN